MKSQRKEKGFTIYLLFVLALLVQIPSRAQNDTSDLDVFLRELQDSAKIPGFSFALVKEGKIVKTFSNGFVSLDERKLVNHSTVFEAASLTKPLVALCALKLYEEGELDLDKSLSEYLNYPAVSYHPNHKLITARMVLSHTSGLPNWRSPRESEKIKFKFKPGSKFSYSGEGFVYLQKAIEAITGKNLEDLAQEIIFEPLGMKESSLVFDFEVNYALGHSKDLKVQEKFEPKTPNAAFSLHTNAREYALFMKEFFEPNILSKGTLEEMLNVQVLMKEKDETMGWGLGLGLNFAETEKFAWHWGDNGAFKAFSIISSESGIGFVFFANSFSGLSIVRSLLNRIYASEKVMETWDFYEQI